ncbi:MAG: class I SAM-dependent RNA methyltransferase [Pseudomonadota bacterium]
METFFALCQPGLEPWVAEELRGILPADAEITPATPFAVNVAVDDGGVEFKGEWAALYRANLYLRTSDRILVRVGAFRATNEEELQRRACTLNWRRYLSPGQNVTVRVICRKSKLFHPGLVAEHVVAAISERLGGALSQAHPKQADRVNPAQLIIVRIIENRCTISIDSSGVSLYKRGYRPAIAKAPLRETLAATLLLASGWDRTSPLLDPFCGSGVIPIEAAMLALGIPPGLKRRFAFMDWPGFDEVLWQIIEREAHQPRTASCPPLFGSDRDAGAIRMAEQNAERAGVAQYIRCTHCAVSSIAPPPQPGWIVTNPPYGIRIASKHDLRNLYAQFGNVLRELCPGWHVNVLSNDLALLGQMKIKFDTSIGMQNGAIGVRFARGTVPHTA